MKIKFAYGFAGMTDELVDESNAITDGDSDNINVVDWLAKGIKMGALAEIRPGVFQNLMLFGEYGRIEGEVVTVYTDYSDKTGEAVRLANRLHAGGSVAPHAAEEACDYLYNNFPGTALDDLLPREVSEKLLQLGSDSRLQSLIMAALGQ